MNSAIRLAASSIAIGLLALALKAGAWRLTGPAVKWDRGSRHVLRRVDRIKHVDLRTSSRKSASGRGRRWIMAVTGAATDDCPLTAFAGPTGLRGRIVRMDLWR